MQDETDTRVSTGRAMRLLQAGVPLSLLLDLCSPLGPDSRGIIAREHSDAAARRTQAP